MPEIYFRFCFLAVHIQTARLSIRTLHDMQYGASHSQCMQCAEHLLQKTGPSSTDSTWFGDNKINCHAIVQPIFMRFTGIVGYDSPHNVIQFECNRPVNGETAKVLKIIRKYLVKF